MHSLVLLVHIQAQLRRLHTVITCRFKKVAEVQSHSASYIGLCQSPFKEVQKQHTQWSVSCYNRAGSNKLHQQHIQREISASTKSCWGKFYFLVSAPAQQLTCRGWGWASESASLKIDPMHKQLDQWKIKKIYWNKWKWQHNHPKSMGHSKSSRKREILSITDVSQKKKERKSSNK